VHEIERNTPGYWISILIEVLAEFQGKVLCGNVKKVDWNILQSYFHILYDVGRYLGFYMGKTGKPIRKGGK